MKTKDIVLAGLFAAVLTVISQISIPLPTGVPLTIQVFGVALTGAVLGWKLGLISTIVYILIGAIGLPVFSGFRGGISVLTGVTGGYIIGWPILASLCGLNFSKYSKAADFLLSLIFAILGLAAVETIGGLQWALLSGDITLSAVFIYSIIAFIPKDVVITIAALLVGKRIRRSLISCGYLES